jgi:hypothetical protein
LGRARNRTIRKLPDELRTGANFVHGPIGGEDPRDAFALLVLADVDRARRSGSRFDFGTVAAHRWRHWSKNLGLDEEPEDFDDFISERLDKLEDQGLVDYEAVSGYQFTNFGETCLRRIVAATGDISLREPVEPSGASGVTL